MPTLSEVLSQGKNVKLVKKAEPLKLSDVMDKAKLVKRAEEPRPLVGEKGKVLGGVLGRQFDITEKPKTTKETGLLSSIFQSTLGRRGAFGMGEQVGKAVGTAIFRPEKKVQQQFEARTDIANTANEMIERAKTEKDPERKKKLLAQAGQMLREGEIIGQQAKVDLEEIEKLSPDTKTFVQSAINTALTATGGAGLTAGKGLLPKALEFGVGAAGFETARQIGEEEEIKPKEIATAGAIGAALPIAGKGLQKIFQKITQPFAKSINEKIIETATRRGIKLPASAISSNKAVGLLEGLSAKGLFGKGTAQRAKVAFEGIQKISDDLVDDLGGAENLSTLGTMIENGFNKMKQNFIKVKNELYEKAIIPSRGRGVVFVEPKDSVKFLDDIIRQKQNAFKTSGVKPKSLDFFATLRNSLKSKEKGINARLLSDTIKELDDLIISETGAISKGDNAVLKKLFATLNNELDGAIKIQRPELAKAIDGANKFYKSQLDLLDTKYGQQIKKFSKQPDKILEVIINPKTSIEEIPNILSLLEKEGQKKLKATLLNNIFSKAKGTKEALTSNSLIRELNKFGDDKLRVLFGQEKLNILKDTQELLRAIGGATKIIEGSQTGFINRLTAEVGLAFINPISAIKLLIGDATFSKFISSEAGQRFLTTGFKPLSDRTEKALTSIIKGLKIPIIKAPSEI
jgi:hypothetical protein